MAGTETRRIQIGSGRKSPAKSSLPSTGGTAPAEKKTGWSAAKAKAGTSKSPVQIGQHSKKQQAWKAAQAPAEGGTRSGVQIGHQREVDPAVNKRYQKRRKSMAARLIDKLDKSNDFVTPDAARAQFGTIEKEKADPNEIAKNLGKKAGEKLFNKAGVKILGEELWEEAGIGEALTKIGGTIKSIVTYIKEHREGKHTGDERMEFVSGLADTLMTVADSVNGVVGTLVKDVPIVGTIIGVISGVIGFAMNLKSTIQATYRGHKMKKHKEALREKMKLKRQMSAGKPGGMSSISWMDPAARRGKGKLQVGTFGETTKDHFRPDKTRLLRLDEKLTSMRGGPGADEDTLDMAEDYDVTKELRSANKKRRTSGIMEMVFTDAFGIIKSIAALEPNCAAAATAVEGVIGAGKLAKKGFLKTRGFMRNHGIGGADLNKSDLNKKQRRQNLALFMYRRFYKMKGENNIMNWGDQVEGLSIAQRGRLPVLMEEYKNLDQQLSATGQAGTIYRSGNTQEMLDNIRGGFYRDSDEA